MKTLSVNVRTSQLRSDPSFLGRILANLNYGSKVLLQEVQGDWLRVRSGQQDGWMHGAALSEKEIVINPGAADVERAATDSEIALAGKGFNASVERAYRQRNSNINFDAVDRMESTSISRDSLGRFVREGDLNSL
ncbi:SH3 domain-containing protein [Nitrincola alkalilacustris]|uniref:SH3 domain-containing protein n=1 Tax=Nitrincola alkalilacustris TaxID=1571224 RepID=UPI00124E3A03|nr:SH3 domain-containing protein [Nitrincola alkalilacustris]